MDTREALTRLHRTVQPAAVDGALDPVLDQLAEIFDDAGIEPLPSPQRARAVELVEHARTGGVG